MKKVIVAVGFIILGVYMSSSLILGTMKDDADALSTKSNGDIQTLVSDSTN